MDNVSWKECQDFIGKLNAMRVTAGRFRLPTEAEWEWACRAGAPTQFCFGDEKTGLFAHAWHWGNSGEFSHPVGTRRPSSWGLFDMHGNAWEWCSDWYDRAYYAKSPERDPPGPASGTDRVLRGGSWGGSARECRSAYRCGLDPESRSSLFGFRLVLSAQVADRLPREESRSSRWLARAATHSILANTTATGPSSPISW